MPASAQAQELRIGFLAPMTGIFAQIGKDMANGFQLYLDENKGQLRRREGDVHRRGRGRQAAGRRAQGREARAPGQGAHVRRRPARLDRLRARAGVSRAEDGVRAVGRRGRRPHAARPARSIRTSSARAGRARSRTIRSGSGPATRATSASSRSARTTRSATRWSAASRSVFEDCGGQVVQKIWPPLGTKDFGPYIPTHQAGRRRHLHRSWSGRCRCSSRSSSQAAGIKKPRDRRRHELRRVRAAVDGRRGARARLGAAVQRGARHAEEPRVRARPTARSTARCPPTTPRATTPPRR